MDIRTDQYLKCLADPTRLMIMLLLHRQGELCVCELVEALNESQPKISRHLAQLRNCQILASRRQGTWIYYRLSPDLPTWASTVLEGCAEGSAPELEDCLAQLTTRQADSCFPQTC